MKTHFIKYWKLILTLLLGLAVFLFWGKQYSAHLSYSEQYQMFLFSYDYLYSRLIIPGGISQYIAEFLVQFYYYTWIGAIILSILFICIQLMIYRISEHKDKAIYYPLSFIPVFALWQFMCDENSMLTFAVSIAIAVGFTWIYKKLNKKLLLILFIPVLYWMTAGATLIFIGWVCIDALRNGIKSKNYLSAFAFIVVVILFATFCPLISSTFKQYQLNRLFTGLDFYRFPDITIRPEIITIILLIIVPWISSILPKVNKRKALIACSEIICITLCGYFYVKSGCDMSKEEALEYDKLVREERWNDIIEKANKKMPDSPFSVTCLNLALGKTGQLADNMFHYYQNGTEGLLPEFESDYTSSLSTGEVFYHLGMINTAERFTFEGMEAIPNFNKSTRCYKRLAETNLINGQYKVAKKYICALTKTLFYRKWAEDAMTYLYNDKKIESHKEWGWLRKVSYKEDFLFSDRDMDSMLGLLFQQNYKNRMAFEYMMAYVLQKRNLERFMQVYPVGRHAGYNEIPRSYQEALAFVWAQSHNSFNGVPWSLSPQVEMDLEHFARLYFSQNNNYDSMGQSFGGTYWFYLLCKK